MIKLWKISLPLKIYVCSISGQPNVPAGPCIVACNHEGPLDSSLIMLALKRDIRFIAARHLLAKHNLAWLYYRLVIFGIGKSIPNGPGSLDTCRALLQKGETIGIFPEGDIWPALRQPRIHTGAVVLSHQTQLPILPVHIENSGRLWPIYPIWKMKFWRWRSVTITIGRPISPPTKGQLLSQSHYQALSDGLMDNILHLRHNGDG